MSFVEYAEKAARLLNILPDASNYPKPVYATFEMAFNNILDADGALIVLHVISQFGSNPIPISLTDHIHPDEINIDLALLRLSEMSLIKIENSDRSGRTIIVHRLIQSVARDIAIRLKLDMEFFFIAMDQIKWGFEAGKRAEEAGEKIGIQNLYLSRLVTSHAGAISGRLMEQIDRIDRQSVEE